MMSSTRLLFEGTDIQAVLTQVRGEYGTDVRIVAADKVRSGGIAGFFARERFEVAVEVDVAEAPIPEPPSALGTLVVTTQNHPPIVETTPELPGSLLLRLIDSVSQVEPVAIATDAFPSRAAFLSLGLPARLLPQRMNSADPIEALVMALRDAAEAPALPTSAGEVIAVVGSGVQAVTAAEQIATTGGVSAPVELVARRSSEHASGLLRMSGPADARRRAARLARRNTSTVIAIDRAHDCDGTWTAAVLAALDVSAVCVVVDAGTKPRDLAASLRSLGRIEALAVVGTETTSDPATIFDLRIPIVSVDGRESSAELWATLIADRISTGSYARKA